jgi:hypothetical protein
MSVTHAVHPRHAHRGGHTGWSSPTLSVPPCDEPGPAAACASSCPLAQRPRQLRRRLHLPPCVVCDALWSQRQFPKQKDRRGGRADQNGRAAAPLTLCERGQHVLRQRLQHVRCRLWCCAPRAARLPRAWLLGLPLLLPSCRNRDTGLVSLLGTAVGGAGHPHCQSSRRATRRAARDSRLQEHTRTASAAQPPPFVAAQLAPRPGEVAINTSRKGGV